MEYYHSNVNICSSGIVHIVLRRPMILKFYILEEYRIRIWIFTSTLTKKPVPVDHGHFLTTETQKVLDSQKEASSHLFC